MKRYLKPASLLIVLVLAVMTAIPAGAADEPVMKLTLDGAVNQGVENSIILKQVRNQIDLADVSKDRADHNSRKLRKAERDIRDGKSMINDVQNQINTAQEQIDQSSAAIDAGIAPQDITLTDPATGQTIADANGNPIVIPAQSNIDEYLQTYHLESLTDTVVQGVKSEIQSQQDILDQSRTQLENSIQSLENGENKLDLALVEAGITLSDKLDLDNAGMFTTDSSADLMSTMADVQYEVTLASYDIYRNQLATLIQKNYFDVLKCQRILEVKNKAMERGLKQYQFAKDSFEIGMKAKDDMLLANTYYKGTVIEYQKAEGELNNALIELKKNMNIPLDARVELEDVFQDKVEGQDLKAGLENGLKNRLEMKKALGEVVVYAMNFEATRKTYDKITYKYKEAELYKDRAKLNYEKTRLEVESSIRQSYETLKSMGKMMNTSKEMAEQAEESLEIAEYKYREGFGVENSLLKKLDLESSAGTIVEVLAAEENLAQVEQKVVEIMYGYNLALMKYYNDIGKSVY